VLGTENFYADLLTQIGGARVSATSLLNDPNADPHAFEASPSAAATVADAKLVIINGLGYDDFMQHLLGASPNASRVVIDVQQLLGLASDANAHVWYDPGTMPKVAAAAEAALAGLEPANAAYFAAHEQAYLASLAPLNAKIAELKASYSGAPVAFTEPVAGYLAEATGLQVLTPEGFQKAIEDGTDPAPADVAAERDLLTGKTVRVLLFNSQVITPLTQQIHDLAVANGIPVVGVAETLPPQYPTYQAWQLAQMNELEAALAQGS
jgi:zinc/manganese transport system substrate-binding protein